MNLAELAAILGNLGEFIGSIAVLATLVYLALQVRQSKALLERQEKIALSQVYQHRTAIRIEILEAGVEPSMAALLARVGDFQGSLDEWKTAFDQLDDTEKQRVRLFVQMNHLLIDNTLYQGSLDMIDPVHLSSVERRLLDAYPLWEYTQIPITPRTREWYEAHKED